MTNPLPELLPCFYCNAKHPEIDTGMGWLDLKTPGYWVECLMCHYKSSYQFKSEETAIEAHNFIATCIEEKIRRTMDGKHD